MKTNGQILYEHYNPRHLKVVLAEDTFRRNPFFVPNENHVPFHLLTERCRQSYEQQAVGHHLFSREAA